MRDAKTREAAPPKEGPTIVQTDSDTVIGPGMMLYPKRGDPTSPPSGGRCGNGRHDSHHVLNSFEVLADPLSTPSRTGIALPALATTLSSSKKKRFSAGSLNKREKKFRPSRLDLGPVDAGQTAEMDSPVSPTDSPVSPASMVDKSLLLASQGTAGVFSQTLHEGLLNSLEAGNSPETSTQAGGLVTVPTMAVSPPL